MDAAQSNSLNSMFIILLSIPISFMFTRLRSIGRDPRTPFKFGLGLLFAGLSFYILSISGMSADESGRVPFSYLLLMYFLLSVGELFMSPVGLSKITDLSPKRIVAFMMGVWFLSSAYAFELVGFIVKNMAILLSLNITILSSKGTKWMITPPLTQAIGMVVTKR